MACKWMSFSDTVETMKLYLTIENYTSLPDGGPLSMAVTGRRGIDIGRDQYLDWTLPDTERVISGKHAEIRYRDGGYWIHDVSRNGVYLNRNPQRIQAAHRLKDGDRIQIGQYLIIAAIEGETATDSFSVGSAPMEPANYWDAAGEIPPPISSRDLKPREELRPVKPDFIDWAVDVGGALPPSGRAPGQEPKSAFPLEEMAWAVTSPRSPPSDPPPMPTPRRPAIEAEPDGAPWIQEQVSSAPAAIAPAEWEAPPLERSPARPENVLGRKPDAVPRAAAPSEGRGADEFVRRFAVGAGIPPETLSWRDPGDLAEEMGVLIRLASENLKQLLMARAETKRAARAANQTMIQALDNNPLKFAPTVDDALRIMLGRPASGYLEARRAFESGFRDLKTHQVKTYSAMQNALQLLMDELDPDAIAGSDEGDRGLGGLLGSRKARLWDLYATRWDALASQHEDGMIDAFMIFFADCYDGSR